MGKTGREDTPPTVGASFVQEVAEVEQGVSRCQELQEFLHERTNTRGLFLCRTLIVQRGKLLQLRRKIA